ncbi:MAG TPA: PadR family transcriptional regulator [Gaiellaceae bacterium]|jgi:PadR family transcriptional regulator AphA|nr:PadR family transcriptional regulator [Gaiellaceae bacterium]
MHRNEERLARGEMAVLALLAERPVHGWALSRDVAPGSEIGEIWSGDRQRVYRALRKLTSLGLIEPSLTEPGEGAHRTVYRPTSAGAATLDAWLEEPVGGMREGESTFMLKLAFLQRSGRDPMQLLNAQRATVIAAMEEIARRSQRQAGSRKVHLTLRLEQARALLTVIDGLSNETARRTATPRNRRAKKLHAAPEPGRPTSDFSGAELTGESDTATIILRFGDTTRGIHVATAHIDDPIVESIVDAGQETGTRRSSHG